MYRDRNKQWSFVFGIGDNPIHIKIVLTTCIVVVPKHVIKYLHVLIAIYSAVAININPLNPEIFLSITLRT